MKRTENQKPSPSVRPAAIEDFPRIVEIYNHYVIRSVATFRLEPVTENAFSDTLQMTKARELPFVVAVLSDTSTSEDSGGPQNTTLGEELPREMKSKQGIIIGYAYAHPYRPYSPAYRHTVEITLYVDYAYRCCGAGHQLMNRLVSDLRHVEVPNPVESSDGGGVKEGKQRIRQVLSVMALDDTGNEGGFGLEKWYGRWGFRRVGHLEKVGYKLGRWIDVLFLQLTLENASTSIC